MRRPLVVDLRNLYEPEKMAAERFEYVSVASVRRPAGSPGGGARASAPPGAGEEPGEQPAGGLPS